MRFRGFKRDLRRALRLSVSVMCDHGAPLGKGSTSMGRILVVMATAATIATAALVPAHAQLTNPFGTNTVGISPDDSARAWAAVRGALQQYTLGARHDWESANGKRAGTATITKIYTGDGGMRCAMVQHAFTKGPGQTYHAPLCEVSKGEWRIAF